MDPPTYENSDNSREKAYSPPPPQAVQQPYYPQQPQPFYPQQQPYPPQQAYPPPSQPYAPYQQPYFAPPPQQQQQQSSVTVVNAGHQQAVGYVQSVPYQSYCGYIVLACFVAWCCGFIFGLIAFILAMIATDRAGTGQASEARNFGRASLGVSIAGIIVGCIIIAIVIGVSYSRPAYYYRSTCYNSYTGNYYYC